MIKKVSIQLNQSLIFGGMAIVEREGHEESIYFDVVIGGLIPQVIVGGRGKKGMSDKEADEYEQALLDLFIKHNVPKKLGTYAVSA